MISDNHLSPPEPCSACEMYYAYKDGLCWECWHNAEADREECKADERRDRDLEQF